jgi:hypothetical protein
VDWKKSSFSTANGDCVELADTLDGVAVRDSKDPDGPVLTFTRAEWRAFLDGARAGEFDDLGRSRLSGADGSRRPPDPPWLAPTRRVVEAMFADHLARKHPGTRWIIETTDDEDDLRTKKAPPT